jgi:DNA invertase Pin-like site-specific DNA recombinase
MKIGYARTSTVDQVAGLDAQIAALTAAGCEEIFSEHASAVGARPELEALFRFLRQAEPGRCGDVVVITRIDRLARSVIDLWELVGRIEQKGGSLVILDFGGNTIDTRTPAGRAMLSMFGVMAQFEREIMLERQRLGIAKAKAEGKYRGRAPTARAKAMEVRALAADGVSKAEIARRLGVHRASVYRILQSESEAREHSARFRRRLLGQAAAFDSLSTEGRFPAPKALRCTI